jgi:hypothetical protein
MVETLQVLPLGIAQTPIPQLAALWMHDEDGNRVIDRAEAMALIARRKREKEKE